MYKKILYPIKFEEFSLEVLSCIFHFKEIGTEEILLLHVIDVSKLPMDRFMAKVMWRESSGALCQGMWWNTAIDQSF